MFYRNIFKSKSITILEFFDFSISFIISVDILPYFIIYNATIKGDIVIPL